uniref:hypothetical protein n=1 Tax=Microbulbifer agarilyticus TaxID=260552 RepID=UPI0002559FBF
MAATIQVESTADFADRFKLHRFVLFDAIRATLANGQNPRQTLKIAGTNHSMLEASRWRSLALAIGQLSRPRPLAFGLLAAHALWPLASAAESDVASAQLEENPYLYLDWFPRGQLEPY